ncbi:MAG: hypothetical protein U0822_26790 [Anaerolineae bacterium]
MMSTRYESVDRTERYYPSFNDSPHSRPVLTDGGTARAFAILVGVLGGLTGLATLLTLLR